MIRTAVRSVVCLAVLAVAAPILQAAEAPPCFVNLSVSRMQDGHSVVLTQPRLTVKQGEPASITVTGDGKTYAFTVLVAPQQGKLVCDTTARITQGDRLMIAPRVLSVVGEPVSITADEWTVSVDAKLFKAGG